MGCEARRVNDEYHCHRCGLQWAVADNDRPVCKTGYQIHMPIIRKLIERHKDEER